MRTVQERLMPLRVCHGEEVTLPMELSNVSVALLAGGLGTRLRSVIADRPKVLAEIRSQPFLSYLLDQIAAAGCRSVVLCTGYLGEQIESTFGKNYGRLRLIYSREQEPLGTAGALKLAITRFESDPVLVMNGDSFCAIDVKAYWDWHRQCQATASMALTRVARSDRFGRVKLDSDARVIEFVEKQHGSGAAWINAGIYFLSQEVLRSIPDGVKVSLEREIFPRWIGRGLYGCVSASSFLDIGTPDDFAAAESFFARLDGSVRRRFVVLDRDGTIIEEREYLSQPEQVALISGAGAALRKLRQMGFGLVVITNQSAIGRGYFDQGQLGLVHERLAQLLRQENVKLDGIYVCPHTPDDSCVCRKPRTGLMEKAAKELDFDLESSLVIGDKDCDIDMGRRAGAITFLVRTGYGAHFENAVAADFVVDDLAAATGFIECLMGAERTIIHGH
jgi:histidinol-phosphate phosphatase family protein